MKRTALFVVSAIGLVLAPQAGAHAEITPNRVPAASTSTFVLSVAGEENAPTTKVAVQMPRALANVKPAPVPGWQVNFGGRVITWTGGRIATGQNGEFEIAALFPDTPGRTLKFPTVQTYGNGTVVRWIGAPSSETPAPTIRLTAARATPPPPPVTQPPPTTTTAAPESDDDSGSAGWLIGAVVLVVLVGQPPRSSGGAAVEKGPRGRGPPGLRCSPAAPKPTSARRSSATARRSRRSSLLREASSSRFSSGTTSSGSTTEAARASSSRATPASRTSGSAPPGSSSTFAPPPATSTRTDTESRKPRKSANPEAKPDWQQLSGGDVWAWHDHRIHYMSPAFPPRRSRRSGRAASRLRLEGSGQADGKRFFIAGSLDYSPPAEGERRVPDRAGHRDRDVDRRRDPRPLLPPPRDSPLSGVDNSILPSERRMSSTLTSSSSPSRYRRPLRRPTRAVPSSFSS